MLEFYELKDQVLKGLVQYIEETEDHSKSYYTFKSPIKLKSIEKLIPFLKEMTTCYFKSPCGDSILGLQDLQLFNNVIDLDTMDDLLKENSDLDFMGAFPFDSRIKFDNKWSSFNQHYFFLPRFVIETKNNITHFKVNFPKSLLSSNVEKVSLINELEDIFSFIHRNPNKAQIKTHSFLPTETKWTESVNKSIEFFKNSPLSKVVLARTKCIVYENEVDAHRLFTKVKKSDELYQFFYHIEHGASFISFTPEKLYSLEKDELIIDSIAGTLKNNGDSHGEALLHSSKDLEEHRIVSRSIENNLKKLNAKIEKLKDEKLLVLPKLFHIHTIFKAILPKNVTNSKLLRLLHPTPAVGGFPKKESLNFIKDNEGINRGFYAGPIGRISKDKSEFAVGIRSMLVNGSEILFYGGAGIVNESFAEKEWQETNDKIESVQCMI